MSIKKKIALPALLAVLLFVATVAAPAANLSQAHAAAFPSSEFLDRWTELHNAMTDNDRQAIRDLRGEIQNLQDNEVIALLDPIIDVLNLNAADQNTLVALFRDLSELTYDPQASKLEDIRITYSAFIQKFAPSGVDLTIDDIFDFLLAVELETLNRVSSMDPLQWLDLLRNPDARRDLIVNSLNAVVSKNPNQSVSRTLAHYQGLTGAMADVLEGFQRELQNDEAAILALVRAYLKTRDKNGGQTPGGGLPGGVGGGGTISPLPALNDLNNKIDELKNKLATATPAEKQQLIKQAISAAIETIQSLNAFDASMKSVSNGTVTINAGGDQLKNVINELAKAINKLKEFLKAAGAEDQAPAFVLTIDVGAVSESNIDFRLAADIVKLATDTGLAGVALRVNGLGATIPLGGEFSGEIRFKVGSKDASEANVATSLKLASKVYDFALSVNGRPLTEFEQPILIRIPLINLSGVDRELLSVAKIVDGKFVFYGGYVEGDAIVEARDTFSSYVVVENKVAFNDTGRVQSWAGRQIEVMAAKGAIEGKAAGVFAPHDNVTRAEFAKMLVKALDLEHAKATENFADVKATDWFAPYVAAAVKHGIIQGRSSTVFDPHAKITRAEMATMIARALKVKYNLKGSADPDAALRFSDADRIPAALKDGVAFAAENGLILGYQGKFNPNDNATRAEAAVVLYRTFHFKV